MYVNSFGEYVVYQIVEGSERPILDTTFIKIIEAIFLNSKQLIFRGVLTKIWVNFKLFLNNLFSPFIDPQYIFGMDLVKIGSVF